MQSEQAGQIDINQMDAVLVEQIEGMSEEELETLIALAEEAEAAHQQDLEALASDIGSRLKEASDGRAASGIETIWEEDIEFYEGIDDANRAEENGGRPQKPEESGGSIVSRVHPKRKRSNVFLNLVRPYVDAASAKVGDMLLPTDDRNFSLRPTPVGDAVRDALNEQEVEEYQTIAKAGAKRAQTRIDDWLVECQWHMEVRKVIHDCAKIGTGVLKGPFPKAIMGRVQPGSKRIDPRNLFPDPACGENIQDGGYVFERDFITGRRLKELRDTDGLGYIASQIDACLMEGPGKRLANEEGVDEQAGDSERYEIWYYNGFLTEDDLKTCGCDIIGDDALQEQIRATVMLVNGRVIKADQEDDETYDFPYDLIPWQVRDGMPWGMGVGRQMRTPQRILNGATRNMMDNAGLSSGPQIIRKSGVLRPADGTYQITPLKEWIISDDATIEDVRTAFMSIDIPTRQQELMNIIQFAMQIAEDVTGLPMLMQGQQGQAPDTVGGMQLMNNNAHVVLRRIAKFFDDFITEPHVRRYYRVFVSMYGDQIENMDHQVDARGSSALVERDIQNQAILQMGQMVLNPAFGVKPKVWLREYMRSQKLDPKRFDDDEEEQQGQEGGGQTQPDENDPAYIQAMNQKKALEVEERDQKIKEREVAIKEQKLSNDKEIAYAELALKERISLDEMYGRLDIDRKAVESKVRSDETRAKIDVMKENTRRGEMQLKRDMGAGI
jgi:hypothetical protein